MPRGRLALASRSRPGGSRGGELRGAKLDHASLRGTNLRGADLRGVSMWGTHVEATDLRDAAGLVGAQLDPTIRDADTRLPDHLPAAGHGP